MKKRGISLVEILVVMVILGLLMGILLPGFRTAAYRAYQTDSFANIRGLYVATQLYQQDHGDWCFSNERYCYVETRYYDGPMASKAARPLWDFADLETGERVKWMPYDFYDVNLAPEAWRNPTDGLGKLLGPMFDWECFDHRGPNWPVVVDPSFAQDTVARKVRGETWLYARLDGSLHTSKVKETNPEPCQQQFGLRRGQWSGLP